MKRVGIISFFPSFTPPRSGGELRLYHIAMHLAGNGFEVEMASPTYHDHDEEQVAHDSHFLERRFPKTPVYNKLHGLMDRLASFRECSGLVCSLAGPRHRRLAQEAERLARSVDVLTHESPFLGTLARRRRRGQLLVYNSYNVETRMARDMFGRSIQGRIATRWISSIERRLLRESDIVLACSEEDARIFTTDFGVERARITIVPNGVDIDAIRPCPSPERRLEARRLLHLSASRSACFFLGSYHPPNIEAVDVIIHQLAMAMPEVDFLVAGNVCRAFENRPIPDNVKMLGLVDEATRDALLHGADVALNPMLSGSGTNLKMLDYLAAGLPVVTSPHGARGLDLDNRRHALIAPADQLRESLEEILGDSDLRKLLASESRRLVEEKFSWHSIGQTVADLYTLKLGRRIVILNDYAVHPAERGGQVRVDAVARRLAGAGVGVTLLTLTSEPEGRRIQFSRHLEELNIPRTRLHRAADAILSQLVACSADDVSALLFTKWLTPGFQRQFRGELRTAEGAMLSHPYLETVTKRMPRGRKLYYDSHNTEYELKQALFRPGFVSRYTVRRIRKAEADACRRSVATFCVSSENRDALKRMVPSLNGTVYICPNGVDCGAMAVLPLDERRRLRREVGFGREFIAVFLGSGHPPNREAAELIIERISREHPRVLFLIVGSVSGWFWNRPMPGNVLLMGMVSTPVKEFLLQTADFALNPMLTGSGTSLKLFDYMAAGLPVLSTAVGARGLDEEALGAVVLLEPDQLSRGLRELLGDPRRCGDLAREARRIAEQYFDWKVALRDMEKALADE